MLAIEIAIAKTHKYASRDSGDTAETVERPTGGMSVILVDGQGSGAAAKTLSMMVSSKTVALLKEGVRDGVAARGSHDFLHAYRHGRVSATLDIVSVDLASSTLVMTRNSPVPYVVGRIESRTGPIGPHRHTRPAVDQYPIRPGLRVIVFTDGLVTAGGSASATFDPAAFVNEHCAPASSAHELADRLLEAAIAADQGRPRDDMTVVAVTIDEAPDVQPIRRLRVSLPVAG
jgi:serine phosphatase RsbU (regulator of sigma subunit)